MLRLSAVTSLAVRLLRCISDTTDGAVRTAFRFEIFFSPSRAGPNIEESQFIRPKPKLPLPLATPNNLPDTNTDRNAQSVSA